MKFAIPTVEGRLCLHFGHCQQFAIVEAGEGEMKTEFLTPPPHEPGVLPAWLHQHGVDVVIAGGMGNRAIQLFDQNGIKVVVGAPSEVPENVVAAYLDGSLQAGGNICDH